MHCPILDKLIFMARVYKISFQLKSRKSSSALYLGHGQSADSRPMIFHDNIMHRIFITLYGIILGNCPPTFRMQEIVFDCNLR